MTDATETKYDAYLAGGWFSPAQVEALGGARAVLETAGQSFYDPQHMCLCPPDAEEGFANYVLNENLKQIRNASYVYASIEGRDLGTVFEVGYAKAVGKLVLFSTVGSALSDVVLLQSTDFEQLLCDTLAERPCGKLFVVCSTAGKDPVQVALAGYAYARGLDVIYYCEGLPEGAQFNLMLARTALAVCTTANDLEQCIARARANASWSQPYEGLVE